MYFLHFLHLLFFVFLWCSARNDEKLQEIKHCFYISFAHRSDPGNTSYFSNPPYLRTPINIKRLKNNARIRHNENNAPPNLNLKFTCPFFLMLSNDNGHRARDRVNVKKGRTCWVKPGRGLRGTPVRSIEVDNDFVGSITEEICRYEQRTV